MLLATGGQDGALRGLVDKSCQRVRLDGRFRTCRTVTENRFEETLMRERADANNREPEDSTTDAAEGASGVPATKRRFRFDRPHSLPVRRPFFLSRDDTDSGDERRDGR